MGTVWIKHAAQLITMGHHVTGPRRKETMNELEIIEDGSIWIEHGIIQAVGKTKDLEEKYAARAHEAKVTDASGYLVTPGLVDPHTHVVFGGSREREFEKRLQGVSYMDIMNAGGGIHATTKMTREATEEELIAQTLPRLDSFLAHGVTTIEGKSGYGLDQENELKQLRVMQALKEEHVIDIIHTFMVADDVSGEFKGREDSFVDLIINEMLLIVAKEGLEKFNDVFCEVCVFT